MFGTFIPPWHLSLLSKLLARFAHSLPLCCEIVWVPGGSTGRPSYAKVSCIFLFYWVLLARMTFIHCYCGIGSVGNTGQTVLVLGAEPGKGAGDFVFHVGFSLILMFLALLG